MFCVVDRRSTQKDEKAEETRKETRRKDKKISGRIAQYDRTKQDETELAELTIFIKKQEILRYRKFNMDGIEATRRRLRRASTVCSIGLLKQ